MHSDGLLYKVAKNIKENFVLTVLSKALVATVPVMLTGSVATIIIMFVPFTIVKETMQPFALLTMSSLAVYLAMSVGYFYGKFTDNESIAFSLVSLCAFLVLIPLEKNGTSFMLPLKYFSSYGMFMALLSSFVVSFILDKLLKMGFVFRLPQAVDDSIRNAFLIIPAFLVSGLVFVIIKYLFSLTSYGNAFTFVYNILQQPLVEIACSYQGIMLAMLLIQLFWFIGMPGDVIVSSLFAPLWLSASMDNFSAYNSGEPLPFIVSGGFFYQFTLFAGFLPLVLAILISSKNQHARSMAKISFIPVLFNVQEPINYGLPITLRSSLFIPWIASRLVAATMAYFFMYYGIVPKPIGIIVPWAMPLFLSGFLVTASYWGAILQALILGVSLLIFMPFINGLDKEISMADKNNSK